MRILIALVLSICASAHSAIIVYNQSYTQTVTGQNAVKKTALKGYFIMDIEYRLFTQVDVDTKAKTFQVYDYSFSKCYLTHPSTPTGEQFALGIPLNTSTNLGAMFYRGKPTTLTAGTNTFSMPKTLTVSGQWTGDTDPDNRFWEWKGSLVFNEKDTFALNASAYDIYEAIDHYVTMLKDAGFVLTN